MWAGEYSYDGDGRRVKRKVGTVETWQVYGLGGELIAEYAQNASYTTPQKEYGYRNGQLLVTLTSPLPGGSPSFSDNPINPHYSGETTVKADHINELRTAIDNLRSHLGMSAYVWTKPTATGGVVQSGGWITADPIIEMRTALDQALGAPTNAYASGLASGQPVKAIHIQELRDRLTAASGSDVRWMVTDQLGTPRMIFDQSGSLATTSRHDYLPFGEELYAGTGGRTQTQGYSLGDGARQKFTQKERDNETGLDYFLARYYSSTQGRFTSVDPFNIALDTQEAAKINPERAKALFNAYLDQPQQWNRYAYGINNPLLYVDPTGEAIKLSNDKDERERQLQAIREMVGSDAAVYLYGNQGKDGNWYVGIYDQGPNGDTTSFEQVNEVAGEIGAIVRDDDIATLEFVPYRTTVKDDSGDVRTIGAANSIWGFSPAVTGYFKGRLTIKMLDWSKHDLGELPGAVMSDHKDNKLTASIMLGHEFGHARERMTGYRDERGNRASNEGSLRLENKIRKLQNPKSPTREIH